MISTLGLSFTPCSRTSCASVSFTSSARMCVESLSLNQKMKRANFRLINVSGFKTDLLEIPAQDPKVHVLFVTGNPGVVSFYTGFLESLYELLGGVASVTAIGHISHTKKDWEAGRLFTIQEQLDHKIRFMEQELQNVEVPIVLVGHSIGSYICLELFKEFQHKVAYCINLYPFLALNTASETQMFIRRVAASTIRSAALSSIGSLIGMLPSQFSRFIVKKTVGRLWSSAAVEVMRTQVLNYHVIRNMFFMANTEFEMLPENNPDMDFIIRKKNQIAFLFGLDDHWGPLSVYDEICKQAPEARVFIEREGFTHAFSCTEAGSRWVAQHVSDLIENRLKNAEKEPILT